MAESSFDLASALPSLLPKAIAWAEARSAEILKHGVTLNEQGLATARRVGVAHPEWVRVWVVPSIPEPEDPQLRCAASQTGLLGPNTAGLTLGHGVYIVRQCTPRLLAHECRHVHQYEQAGSIATFLPVYLQQIAQVGYERAPYEVDARAWELS
jgi:hypothetical protein